MFKSYFRTAIRNIRKHKIFSFINIAGLALSLMTVWLIALFIYDELSFDNYNTKADRIYRLVTHGEWDGGKFDITGSSALAADALKNDFPEVQDAVRLDVEGGGVIAYDDKTLKDDAIFFCDPSIFSIFTYQFLAGDVNALKHPNTIVLTKSLAEKFFKDPLQAVNKTVTIDNAPALVAAVINDVPANSHFRFDALRSLPEKFSGDWGNLSIYTYLLLKPGSSIEHLRSKMPGFVKKYMAIDREESTHLSVELQPLRSIHLHSHLGYELGENHDIKYVYILSLVGVLILLIALINYINITTARAAIRLREVAIRKIIGSGRKSLISLFLVESTTIIVSAALLSAFLVMLVIPSFNVITGKELSTWRFGILPTCSGLLLFSGILGLAGGLYPAFFLSRFAAIPALKNQIGNVKGQVNFRKALVMFQFAVTMIMISASLIIYLQLQFVTKKDLGFNRKQVLTFHLDSRSLREKVPVFRSALLQQTGVEAVASAGNPIGNNNIGMIEYQVERNGALEKQGNLAYGLTIDEAFIPAMQIHLAEGRNFSSAFASDSNDVIVNETLVRKHGWKSGLGKRISRGADPSGKVLFSNIIGVVKDYHLYSLQHKIEPEIMRLPEHTKDKDNMYVRVNGSHLPNTLANIERVFHSFDAVNPFEYHFLDQNFAVQYDDERRQGQVLLAFTILTISIAAMGLFGLITFTVSQRVKEIGIRKVLGASVGQIVIVLTSSMLKIVTLAMVVAVPVAWLVMDKWLEEFAYRIRLNWWILGIAGCIGLIIALGTLSIQAVKAAIANPVKSLRSE